MRLNWNILLPSLLILVTSSCFDKAAVYPSTPSIEFSSICFVDVAQADQQDTLSLTLKFKDGDGDLGLDASDPNDSFFPYNEKFYYFRVDNTSPMLEYSYFPPQWQSGPKYLLNAIVVNKNLYWKSSIANNVSTPGVANWVRVYPVNYADKRTNPLYGSLPSFVTPFSCTNWEVLKDENQKNKDTVHCKYNTNHYNLLIDFYTKNNDGSFTKYDFSKFYPYPNCVPGGYNGRFPVLSNDPKTKSPLEGTLQYNLKSPFFLFIFSIKTLKLKLTIIDRALNKSNELETPEFTLQSVKCN